jgi:hypothetical protein
LARRFPHAPPHEAARDALILTGTLESAAADATFPDCDGVAPLIEALRQATVLAGHVLWHAWRAAEAEAEEWWQRWRQQIDAVPDSCLPQQVELTVPEGYSQYAVYPEMYLEAAKRCRAELGPIEAVCLGLRSIGTSLSAVVTASLEEMGCRVRSATLRPRGHPYDRRPRLRPELKAALRPVGEIPYLLVDEGPGISGSSLSGTAAMLRDWGVPEERILLFPSWQTDGAHLQSRMARETWSHHRQFTASFDDVWLGSGRLQNTFPGELQDVSAGRWRAEVYAGAADYPAVQPQHERRKYLLSTPGSQSRVKLLKFAGLGKAGERKLERAHRLASLGFTPEPETLAHGFLLRPFVPGTPVRSGEVNQELLHIIALYLAHLSREHRAEPTVTHRCLAEMAVVNVTEGLGEPAAAMIPSGDGWEERVVALDGRMLAHEWIRTPDGYLKVDALDHHDDHFFPGCQDIAWDLAAAAVELDLEEPARASLVERYRTLSGDLTIARRLPFYTTAYLAFRLGYSTMATTMLGNTADARRFAGQADRYREVIGRELGSATGARRHG